MRTLRLLMLVSVVANLAVAFVNARQYGTALEQRDHYYASWQRVARDWRKLDQESRNFHYDANTDWVDGTDKDLADSLETPGMWGPEDFYSRHPCYGWRARRCDL